MRTVTIGTFTVSEQALATSGFPEDTYQGWFMRTIAEFKERHPSVANFAVHQAHSELSHHLTRKLTADVSDEE